MLVSAVAAAADGKNNINLALLQRHTNLFSIEDKNTSSQKSLSLSLALILSFSFRNQLNRMARYRTSHCSTKSKIADKSGVHCEWESEWEINGKKWHCFWPLAQIDFYRFAIWFRCYYIAEGMSESDVKYKIQLGHCIYGVDI